MKSIPLYLCLWSANLIINTAEQILSPPLCIWPCETARGTKLRTCQYFVPAKSRGIRNHSNAELIKTFQGFSFTENEEGKNPRTLIFHFYQRPHLARQWVYPSCLGGQWDTPGWPSASPPSRMSSPSLWGPTPSSQDYRASVSTPPSPSSPSTRCKSPTSWLGSVLVKKITLLLEIIKENQLFSNILFHLACWLDGRILSYIVCFCRIWN